MKAQNLPASGSETRVVLHYTGADDDRGGVMSVIRGLAGAGRFECILGVNPGFVQRRSPPLPVLEFPQITGEVIGLRSVWRARAVARAVRSWLLADPRRIFHAHSRAGMVVAWWLVRQSVPRVVVSVHCYGRQRWFYRAMARRLGARLFWLSPAMKRYYGVDGDSWTQCIPGCVPLPAKSPEPRRQARSGFLQIAGVGAIVCWKGWHLVLQALAELPAEVRARVGFRHIGGPGDSADSQGYAGELRAMTTALGLVDTVQWLGEQPSAAELLAECDCLVVASDREPFSIAVLEALSAGLPVLAADSGGAVDLLKPDVTGWFFRSGDASDLARVIAKLVETDAIARVRVTPEEVRPFTAPVVAERWDQVYARS